MSFHVHFDILLNRKEHMWSNLFYYHHGIDRDYSFCKKFVVFHHLFFLASNRGKWRRLCQSYICLRYTIHSGSCQIHSGAALRHMSCTLLIQRLVLCFQGCNPNIMSCLFHFGIDQHRIFYKHLENFHYQQCHRTIQLHMRYICLKLVKARTQKCSSKNRMGNLRMLEVCWFLNSTRQCLLHKAVQFFQ